MKVTKAKVMISRFKGNETQGLVIQLFPAWMDVIECDEQVLAHPVSGGGELVIVPVKYVRIMGRRFLVKDPCAWETGKFTYEVRVPADVADRLVCVKCPQCGYERVEGIECAHS